MTEAEVREFLDAPRSMALATHGADGEIHQVAMWYGFWAGRLAMTSFGRSQKVVNLRRDPRFSGLVEAGDTYATLRGVHVRGTAELVEDADRVIAVVDAIGARYARPGNLPADAKRAAAGRVAILFDITHTASWDHRKLGGSY
ncbi:MAG TPA: TIGR03618 family F420-dependent PPOX class oxidoreductase [Pseudonocardia sp.]|jgi:PPOX class probable F420-dependent enzyme